MREAGEDSDDAAHPEVFIAHERSFYLLLFSNEERMADPFLVKIEHFLL